VLLGLAVLTAAGLLQLGGMRARGEADCTLYVDERGNDLNDGKSAAAAFATIQKAAELVIPGDVVCILDGIYTNSDRDRFIVNLNRGGTADQRITFKSVNRWGAVLDGQNYTTDFGWNFGANAAYVRVEGLEVRATRHSGFWDNNTAHHLYLLGNHIHHIANYCTDGDADHAYGKSGAYSGEAFQPKYITFDSNIIHDIGRLAEGEQGCHYSDPNTSDYYRNHDHGLYISQAVEVAVVNNVFYNNDNGWSVALARGTSNVVVSNNTFARPNPWRDGHISIYSFPDTGVANENILIQNNIFFEPTAAAIRSSGDLYGLPHRGVTIRNNLLLGADRLVSYVSGDLTNIYVIQGNILGEDPHFLDLPHNDFRLTASSPAIDAGTAQDAPSTDSEGVHRPQGAGYEIGAHEFLEGGVTPSFSDVPPDHWAFSYVEALYQGGYVKGCRETPAREYCPEDALTRAEAAVFVTRGHHTADFLPPEPDLAELHFADVARGSWSAKWVEQLWQDGFTAGCATSPLRFCAETAHTRAEATVFFLRMLRGKDYLPGEPTSVPYADVARGTWYFKWAAAASDAGLTQDCEDPPNRGDDRFRPQAPITRAEAACMMARAVSEGG